MEKRIIIFDGVCKLCNGAVKFIITRDSEAKFLFTPLQSEFALALLAEHKLVHDATDTIVLVKERHCYVKSDAVLEIIRELDGFWPKLWLLRFVPKVIRDCVYDIMAKNRYRVMGRNDSCLVPTKDIKNRFIGA